MAFSSPLWLIALLPWAAVTVYLLWGRRKRISVPFLDLWQIPVQGRPPRRKLAAPPLALAMAIASMLLAVLAASGLNVAAGAGGSTARPLTVIVDRGITMSARSADQPTPRYGHAAEAVAREVGLAGSSVPLDLHIVPRVTAAAERTNASDLTAKLAGINTTAVPTSDAVRRLVRDRLAETDGPVIVVTDADLGPLGGDDRVVQVVPEGRLRNAGIAMLAARESPRPQVMVRVRNNGGGAPSATLSVGVDDGEASVQRVVELPPAGEQREYFFDVPRLGETLSAHLLTQPDDLKADDRAWLVRESSWPVVEAKQPVGRLERLLDLYRQLRPAGPGSRRLYLVGNMADLTGGADGVVVHGGNPTAAAPATLRPATVAAHPVTEAVGSWTSLELPPAAATSPPAGWIPLLSAADGRVLVAVKETQDVRQAWVGIDVDRWAHTPEYVVFWTALLDWVGRTGDARPAFASYALDDRDPDWQPAVGDAGGGAPASVRDAALWPGLFVRQDGARRAYNAPPVEVAVPVGPPQDWRVKLKAQTARAASRWDLSPALLLASTVALLLAAATWRRGSRRDRTAGSGGEERPHPADFIDSPRRRRRRSASRAARDVWPIPAES